MPVRVRPGGSLPIKFPDLLLFTAFVQLQSDPAGEPIAKVQAAVTIQEPAATAPSQGKTAG